PPHRQWCVDGADNLSHLHSPPAAPAPRGTAPARKYDRHISHARPPPARTFRVASTAMGPPIAPPGATTQDVPAELRGSGPVGGPRVRRPQPRVRDTRTRRAGDATNGRGRRDRTL